MFRESRNLSLGFLSISIFYCEREEKRILVYFDTVRCYYVDKTRYIDCFIMLIHEWTHNFVILLPQGHL